VRDAGFKHPGEEEIGATIIGLAILNSGHKVGKETVLGSFIKKVEEAQASKARFSVSR
jgi:cation transport ATPase